MALPTGISVADVVARFHRPLSDTEQDAAEAWLEDAWEYVQERRPLLSAQLGIDITVDTLRRVLVQMVIRKAQNPEGLAAETIDDYSFKRDATTSSGELYLTADELWSLTVRTERRSRQSVKLVAYGES